MSYGLTVLENELKQKEYVLSGWTEKDKVNSHGDLYRRLKSEIEDLKKDIVKLKKK